MIWIYRLLYPCFIGILGLLSPFSKKLRGGLFGRLGLNTRLSRAVDSWKPQEKKVWIHFSSAGEFEQALPVLDSIKASSATTRIVLTYFSPSAERAIEYEIKRRQSYHLSCPWDFADYSPFDFPWTIRKFLNILQPSCFTAIHRELWPELLFECRLRNIPCYLIGAYFPPSSRTGSLFYRFCLNHLNKIAVVDEPSRQKLIDMNPALSISVLGDPRIERVLFRKKHFSSSGAWKNLFQGQTVLVGASLWDEDFDVLLNSLIEMGEKTSHLRVVIVPHEPNEGRINSWSDELKAIGFNVRKWSDWIKSPEPQSHLIVDQVGLLAELYSVATCVLVGGSFKKRVHNVLEPLVYHCGIVTGPFISNSSEATELAKQEILSVVSNSSELTRALAGFLNSSEKREEIANKAIHFLSQKEGVSQNHVSMILN